MLPNSHSRKPRDRVCLSPAGTPKSSGGLRTLVPTPSLVHLVLGNFPFAVSLISLIISIVFFAVAWLTVLRDARLMRGRVLSNATGVSLSLYFNECVVL